MKLHILQATCSALIVGLGQIIKGETEKGVAILLTFYFFLPAVVYFSLVINPYLFLSVLGFSTIFGIMLWIYSIGDAFLKP
jgi:hypothetical protein